MLISRRSAPGAPRRTTKKGPADDCPPSSYPLPTRSLWLAVVEVVQIETVDEVGKRRHPPDLFFIHRANQVIRTLRRLELAGRRIERDPGLLQHCLLREDRHVDPHGKRDGVRWARIDLNVA